MGLMYPTTLLKVDALRLLDLASLADSEVAATA